MKDFNIAKYLREHQQGSFGILNHYIDLQPVKEDKDLGQQDAMPEPYEGPEDPIDGLGGELDRDMDVSMNEEESELGKLTQEYQAWLDKNNLPQMSADELLYDENIKKTPEQKKYLQMFIDRWNAAEEEHIKGLKEEEPANAPRIMDLGGEQIEQGVISLLDDGFDAQDIMDLVKDFLKAHLDAKAQGKSF